MVFRNEKNGKMYYSISDSTKQLDGTIQVMEWEYSEQKETQYGTLSEDTEALVDKFKENNKKEKEDPFFASSNIEVDDSDLPF